MIDIEKFICSLMAMQQGGFNTQYLLMSEALKNQGLKYKDGKIVRVSPAFKDIKDESIRKIISDILLTDSNEIREILDANNVLMQDVYAWLEKQATNISSFPKEQQVFMKKYVSLDKITLIKLLSERDANNAEIIESFEKQDEQKPAIKLEHDDNGEPVLTPFEAELFSMMSEAWQGYSFGEEVNLAKIVKEHSIELLERAKEQNPAWSEEDEETLNYIIAYIEKNKSNDTIYTKKTEVLEGMLVWLKSLKDRYFWKPTDAQIASLTIACDRNDRIGFDLTQLLRDLKKLKE